MPHYIIGIDEVGRGPLAGPVTVCALAVRAQGARAFLQKFLLFSRGGDLKDSKRMSRTERERCVAAIQIALKQSDVARFKVSHVSAKVIDRIGIVPAVRRAVSRSLRKLSIPTNTAVIFLDGGLSAPPEYVRQRTFIKGDQTIPVIALSSVIAKVYRDRKMVRLSKKYPRYGFEEHVGYGTRQQYRAIRRLGVCEIHRRSFLTKIEV